MNASDPDRFDEYLSDSIADPLASNDPLVRSLVRSEPLPSELQQLTNLSATIASSSARRRKFAYLSRWAALAAACVAAIFASGIATATLLIDDDPVLEQFCVQIQPTCNEILFSRVQGDTGKGAPVYLIPLDTNEPALVDRDGGSLGAVGSSARLFLTVPDRVEDGRLLFSLDVVTATERIRIVDDVDAPILITHQAGSAAYLGDGRLHFMDLQDLEQVASIQLPSEWTEHTLLSLSPTGNSVIVRARSATSGQELWLVSRDGFTKRLSVGINQAPLDAVWRDSLTVLAFNDGSRNVFAIDAISGDAEPWGPGEADTTDIRPSPSGDRVAITTASTDGPRCRVTDAAGALLRSPSHGEACRAWSPDGQMLVTMSQVRAGFIGDDDLPYISSRSVLHIYDESGRHLRDVPLPEGEILSEVSWSLDSKDLIVSCACAH